MMLQIDNQSLRAPLTLTGSWSLASLLLKTTLKIFPMAIFFLGDDSSFSVTVTVTITFPHCLLLSVWKLCHWPSSILLSDHLDDHYDHNDHHYLDDLDDYDDPNNHKIIIL